MTSKQRYALEMSYEIMQTMGDISKIMHGTIKRAPPELWAKWAEVVKSAIDE